MRKRSLMLVVAAALAVLPLWTRAETLPNTVDDKEFWRLITDLSEPGGRFQQQFMSNEDSFQFVIPGLKANTQKNGVYIGVGSEQNFTYIAAIQPKVSFLVDIRHDNMIEHLIYKAIFELAADRADFLSRLFSRKRPSALEPNTTAKALFDAFQSMEPDASIYEQNVRAVTDRLVTVHKFLLTEADKADVARILNAFRTAGPYSLKGTGDITNPTYAQLMAMADPAGTNQSYLATEENFRVVRKLQSQNAVIPLTGDFAGEKTLISLGQYLKDHDAAVDVFYVSNVERYLFDDFAHGRQFYANLASIPLKPSSTFVRSVTTDISKRLGFPLPDGKEKWRTLLFSINDCLKGLADGRIQGYRDLFTAAK